jgi:hypothetical protein
MQNSREENQEISYFTLLLLNIVNVYIDYFFKKNIKKIFAVLITRIVCIFGNMYTLIIFILCVKSNRSHYYCQLYSYSNHMHSMYKLTGRFGHPWFYFTGPNQPIISQVKPWFGPVGPINRQNPTQFDFFCSVMVAWAGFSDLVHP